MMSEPSHWPPLVVAKHIPRAVRWRDIVVTLTAWAGFVWLLDEEFALFFGALKALGLGGAEVKVDWASYLEQLAPFFLAAAVLATSLVVFSLRTLRRRARALNLPQPAPLLASEQARDEDLDEAVLIAARQQKVVIVHDHDGRLTIAVKTAV
jgi:poly-beta-1,6-N-acetyl-D-glucosamine biosynthesis protein PgaD